MNVSSLFGISTYLSNLKLVLTMVGIASLLSAITLLILTISHLKHKSRSPLTKPAKEVTPPNFPASL